MDAVKFVKEWERMCDSYEDCVGCPAAIRNNKRDVGCKILKDQFTEECVAIVEKWSAEHPVKTRQSEFLKMFPNAAVCLDGMLEILPCFVDKNFNEEKHYCDMNCVECREKYWLAEVE